MRGIMIDLTEILAQQTNGINCDVTTEDVVAKLQQWDSQYGIDIKEVSYDSLVVIFKQLPEDLDALAQEIYEFCPDVIDQGFGCMDDALPMMITAGKEIPPDVKALIEGVDWDDPDFGLTILRNSLLQDRFVFLWWD